MASDPGLCDLKSSSLSQNRSHHPLTLITYSTNLVFYANVCFVLLSDSTLGYGRSETYVHNFFTNYCRKFLLLFLYFIMFQTLQLIPPPIILRYKLQYKALILYPRFGYDKVLFYVFYHDTLLNRDAALAR